jgi:hypothetical protein
MTQYRGTSSLIPADALTGKIAAEGHMLRVEAGVTGPHRRCTLRTHVLHCVIAMRRAFRGRTGLGSPGWLGKMLPLRIHWACCARATTTFTARSARVLSPPAAGELTIAPFAKWPLKHAANRFQGASDFE